MKIRFMTKEEFLTSLSEYPYKKLFVKSLEEAAYCKTEFFSEAQQCQSAPKSCAAS